MEAELKRVYLEVNDSGGWRRVTEFDLADFEAGTLPPVTRAKKTLIGLSMDSPERFVYAFKAGDVEGFPKKGAPALLTPCLSQDFYELYGVWCHRQGLVR